MTAHRYWNFNAIEKPETLRMYIDISAGEKSWRDLYRLCISFITPRPIALVSTVSPAGVRNLAPFSFYNMVAANPPVVMISTGIHRDGRVKDTFANAEQSREFAIATVVPDIARQMADCAAELPSDRSEFDFSGLTPAPATKIRAALVRESPINLECTLRDIYRVGEGAGSSRLLFGNIVAIHVASELLDADGVCDPRRLQTVGRLGGKWYANTAAPYEMEIPTPDRPARG